MEAANFCYWLQGMFELCDPKSLDAKQTDLIRRHLNLVFIHDIDPKSGPKEYQEKLQAIHDGSHHASAFAETQAPHPLSGIQDSNRPEVLYRC